ncbi:hypothetical protein BHYA_0121g00300 [Botrytis hyacinthi]|uniref:Uncharacterized protein n=1 Tax=Botrytis hyacinthi TaxID=278943 RepID=A0A4Z1GML7_9HELO|nr:hypothetical protein BHYA_0121g00300 [Botrytis hyacinthi]
MAFYDSSSDPEVGFPIILEPDDDSLFEMRLDDTRLDNDTMKEVHHVKEVKKVNEVAKSAMVPKHPISSMQGAFAESMQEASDTARTAPKIGDAATRRKILIEQDVSEDTHPLRWQRQPGQKYHELWKLMAQISFGIYLLLNGIARDEEQVMSILQGHVNEVDGFLEMTLEDFDLAQSDIDERLKHLKLPLQNLAIFDSMLEDRAFRSQIVSGNERIEHVITRTAAAMKDTILDAQQGMDACREFTLYLAGQKDNRSWRKQRPNMERVFDAMCGNVEGWHKAYVSLQTKGNHLGVSLGQLGSIVAEMDRRAGRISRESRFSNSSPIQAPAAPVPRNLRASMIKELPSDPNPTTPAISAILPAIALVQDREQTPEPESEPESEPEPEPESESEGEPEPELLYTLKPITYSPLLFPTTYSPTLAPTTYSPIPSATTPIVTTTTPVLPATTYSPILPPTTYSPMLPPTTYSPLLLPTTYSPNPSPKPSPKPSPRPSINTSPKTSPKASPETSPRKEVQKEFVLQSAPEGKRKPSLRKRFSFKNKETETETDTLKPPPKLISAPRITSVAESVVDPYLYLKPNTVVRPRERPEQRRIEPLDLSADREERQREKQIREERSRERIREERRREERREERSRESNREERRNRDEKSRDRENEIRKREERKGSGPLSIPRHPELAKDTPPSRGVDSAYCSESDPPIAIRSIQEHLPSPAFQSPSSAISAPVLMSRERDIPPPILTRDFIPSPHSEKQFFRPVNASPHSPLQRPWTAAPMHHHERVPSGLSRSMAPSRMGMSVMSDTTTVTMEDGKKVKKKRSAFGWLKKAFSLSEEERAEYEERKRRQDPDPYYEQRPPRQFLDGKRLPQPQGIR